MLFSHKSIQVDYESQVIDIDNQTSYTASTQSAPNFKQLLLESRPGCNMLDRRNCHDKVIAVCVDLIVIDRRNNPLDIACNTVLLGVLVQFLNRQFQNVHAIHSTWDALEILCHRDAVLSNTTA